jgi:hypothetical protein
MINKKVKRQKKEEEEEEERKRLSAIQLFKLQIGTVVFYLET